MWPDKHTELGLAEILLCLVLARNGRLSGVQITLAPNGGLFQMFWIGSARLDDVALNLVAI